MDKIQKVETKEDALRLLNIAMEHEWAVSFEYTIHAYSEIKDQLKLHLGLNREHLFTQNWLLKNVQKIKGLK